MVMMAAASLQLQGSGLVPARPSQIILVIADNRAKHWRLA